MHSLRPAGARTQIRSAHQRLASPARRAATTPRAEGASGSGGAAPPQDKERRPWEFNRFLKTVFYFNPPSELAWSAATLPLRMLGVGGKPAAPPPGAPAAHAPAGATRPVYVPGDPASPIAEWGSLDDVVMGGASASGFSVRAGAGEGGAPAGVFAGFVTTANNGGFASVRTRNLAPPLDLGPFDGMEIILFGNGLRYKLVIKTDDGWDGVGYTASFDTAPGAWQTVRVPFSSLVPVFRARTQPGAAPFDPRRVTSLQLMLSKFEYDGILSPAFKEGAFELPVAGMMAYSAGE